jgi:hypothetical protein
MAESSKDCDKDCDNSSTRALLGALAHFSHPPRAPTESPKLDFFYVSS